jgi:hypothetical protein
VRAATRVNAEQASKRTNAQADLTAISGKAEMAERVERRLLPAAAPGYWRRHVHKESVRNAGKPQGVVSDDHRKPVRDRLGALGWRRGS